MKIRGFILMELLITMMLFFLLSIIGMASYSYFMDKNEQQTIIDELRTAIQFAKTQSIILGAPVSLSSLDTSLNWCYGMTLTTLNKDIKKQKLIYQWHWHHPNWSLNWMGTNSLNKIIFSNNPTQAISNGRFSLVNHRTQVHVEIILNRLGRIRVT